MTAIEAIKAIMKEQRVSQAKLAEKMKVYGQQWVYNMLNAKHGVRTDSLIKAMEAMGYEVVLRNKVNDSEIVLELGEEER